MTQTASSLPLAQQRCSHQAGPALDAETQAVLMSQLAGWTLAGHGSTAQLSRIFTFADFHRTMAFVNAVAWVAHEQDHHPDMQVSYNRCTLTWATHSVGGLSVNDFICAARVDALLA